MNNQWLNARHQRLFEFLIKCGLQPEKFRFSEASGRVYGHSNETKYYSIEKQSCETSVSLDFAEAVKEQSLKNEYLLILKIEEFAGDFNLLIAQLLYWLFLERQVQQFDYEYKWNNNQSININVFFDIKERGYASSTKELKVC